MLNSTCVPRQAVSSPQVLCLHLIFHQATCALLLIWATGLLLTSCKLAIYVSCAVGLPTLPLFLPPPVTMERNSVELLLRPIIACSQYVRLIKLFLFRSLPVLNPKCGTLAMLPWQGLGDLAIFTFFQYWVPGICCF